MDQQTINANKLNYYHMLSMTAIKNDSETLKAIISTLSQSTVAFAILPYISLFCTAVEEYCSSCDMKVEFQDNSSLAISDIRNKLKLFSDKYSKSQTQILTTDSIQDNEFKRKLRFNILARLNCYYNLGIFFNDDGKIVGNTQYMYYMFQDKRFSRKNICGSEAKKFGTALGSMVAAVCNELRDFLPGYAVEICRQQCSIYYQDYNTNKNFSFFPGCENDKSLSLWVLHLLCSINFIRYSLNNIVPMKNIWLLRAKYITVYYVYKSLERFQSHYQITSIQSILDNNRYLIDSSFRSCMMHYGFVNKGVPAIKDKYLSLDRTFFGIVESCFEGMGYNILNEKLDQAIAQISDCLSNIVTLDASHRKILST